MTTMNNKGSILIFVLIFIAFSASTVIIIYEKSIKNYAKVADDFYENQSNIYAMTALTGIKKVIADDDNAYDSNDEDWANIPLTKVPYGSVSVSVKPLDSKIALNNLASTDTEVAERYMQACENIFTDESITSVTCAEIKDYIDEDSDITAGGAENKTYTYNGVEIRTKNAPLSTLSELKILFPNPDDFQKVKDYFTTDSTTGIDMNFASEEVINAFLPELKDYSKKIVDYTETGKFKDVSNIQAQMGIPVDTFNKVLPYITVKSTLFYVKTEVTLNDEPRYYHALIRKNGNTVDVIRFLAGIDAQYY